MLNFSTTVAFCGKPTINHKTKTIESPAGTKKLSALAYGYDNQQTSFELLFHWLTVDGYPYAPALKQDGHRHSDNFQSCSVAFVDIDHGMSIEEIQDDRLYKRYGSGFYTTASHTDDNPRFRILFCLEKPITSAEDMTLLYKALIRYYGTEVADKTCKDPCRQFYGSINAAQKEMTDRILPASVVNKLIKKQREREAKQIQQKAKQQHTLSPLSQREPLTDAYKQRVLELARGMYLGHYPDWIRFGWGLKEGGFDVSDFCYVTQGMMNQKTTADATRVWNAGVSGRVTMGTCIHMLKRHYGASCLDNVKKSVAVANRKPVASTRKKRHCLDAFISDPGTGKSTALWEYINNSHDYFIIALPSHKVMGAYQEALTDSIAIRHGTQSVSEQLNYALYSNQRIIIITHAALISCIDKSTFQTLTKYHLCIDEVFQPLTMQMLTLDKSIAKDGILTQVLEFKKLKGCHGLMRVKIKDKEKYNQYLKTTDTKDTIENEKTKAFLQSIADPTKIVIIGKMQQSKKGNYCVATLFNIHLFKYFKSVTVVSAFLEYTMLYHLLDRYYNIVNVTPNYNLTRSLDHRFSSLVLMPLTEQKYSKNFRDKTRFFPSDEREFYVDYCKEHKQHYPDAITFPDFVTKVVSGCNTFDVDCTLMVNNLDDGYPKVGVKISAMSHGINIYQDSHSIAYAAAFNLPPWTYAFLNKLLPDYDLWFEQNVLTAIQDIMRTSLRDTNSTAVVNALVSDMRTCIEIKSLLKGLPEIKHHCLTNVYDHYTLENEKKARILLTEDEKRERKRESNQKFNAIHNKKRAKK